MANAVYIKKYSGTNYFFNRVFVDSIKITQLLNDAIPIFSWDTESPASADQALGTIYPGDFALKFSFAQTERSQSGKSISEFLLRNDDLEEYFFLVIFTVGEMEYSGTANPEHISAAFNYGTEDYDITVWCFGILKDFAGRVKRSALSTLNFPDGQIKTFEDYIPFHFGGLTSGTVLINLPSQSYANRLAPYGNPAGVWAYGDFFNFIENKSQISRWEAFRELSRGLGFSYEMYLNPGSEETNEPEFILNIFFLKDIESIDPIRIDMVIKHNLDFTRLYSKWLYLEYRHFVLSGDKYSNGIIRSKTDYFQSDADNGHDVLYPSFLPQLNGNLLNYDEGQGALLQVYKNDEYREFELKQYSYNTSTGQPIGKLMPPTQTGVTSVGMAYAKIFNAATGSGTNIDRYDNKPIQRYAIENYKRYLKSVAKRKTIKVALSLTKIKKPFQNIVGDDGAGDENYYVSSIRDLNITNDTMEVILTKY